MITSLFDDPRGRKSEELSFDAERAWAAGDGEKARALFAQAAALEETVAREAPESQPRVRSLLAISAVALWQKAEHYDEAERAVCHFLSMPWGLTPQGIQELRELLERCFRERELTLQLGKTGEFYPLEMKLDGGRIRPGLAPASVVRERQELISSVLVRIGEWQADKPYRKQGAAANDVLSAFDVLEAPARAASYGLRLYIVGPAQAKLQGSSVVSPRQIVERFLDIASCSLQGAASLQEYVKEAAYARAFARAFRDLGPDGSNIKTVAFFSPTWRIQKPVSTFEVKHTRALTEAMQKPVRAEERFSDEGILKVVNLRASLPYLGIVADDGDSITCQIKRGIFDDTLGPKLNRRVRVSGYIKRKRDGGMAKHATDVALTESVELASSSQMPIPSTGNP